MRIPSPDGALVSLADAFYGIPQSRGVPLPIALTPVCMAPTVGAVTILLSLPGIGQWPFVPAWILMAGLFAFRGYRQALAYRRDARAWTAEKARDYRARAVALRGTGAPMRCLALGIAVSMATVAGYMAGGGAPLVSYALNAAAYAVMALMVAAVLYARCVMPRDPDLRARAGVPQAA